MVWLGEHAVLGTTNAYIAALSHLQVTSLLAIYYIWYDGILTENAFRIVAHLWGDSPKKEPIMRNFDIILAISETIAAEQTVELPVIWDAMTSL